MSTTSFVTTYELHHKGQLLFRCTSSEEGSSSNYVILEHSEFVENWDSYDPTVHRVGNTIESWPSSDVKQATLKDEKNTKKRKCNESLNLDKTLYTKKGTIRKRVQGKPKEDSITQENVKRHLKFLSHPIQVREGTRCCKSYLCNDSFSIEELKEIHQEYWLNLSPPEKKMFLYHNINSAAPKRKKNDRIIERKTSRSYYLKNKRVCGIFF